MYMQNRKRLTDIENKLAVTKEKREEKGANQGSEINRYKLGKRKGQIRVLRLIDTNYHV